MSICLERYDALGVAVRSVSTRLEGSGFLEGWQGVVLGGTEERPPDEGSHGKGLFSLAKESRKPMCLAEDVGGKLKPEGYTNFGMGDGQCQLMTKVGD